MFRKTITPTALFLYLAAATLYAQHEGHSMLGPMQGMAMPGDEAANQNSASALLMNEASGTSLNPEAWKMPMVMSKVSSWDAMLMGSAFIVDTQQSGPRGGDKLYSPNWFMGTAQRNAGGKSALQFDLMLSLDPATITGERYPLLFQTGETAYGKPLVDGQHPHNFVMALGVRYAHSLSKNTIVDVYFAPVGDPALGPVAFPHRASAAELPQAPISHHLQDSTHVASEVLTAGVSFKKIRWEASGFYGSEPGENRWAVAAGPINSWSTRLWFMPNKNWAAQVSTGRISHPEALDPGDQWRSTASVSYSKVLPAGSGSLSAVWGNTHSLSTLRNLNSYLVEGVIPVTRKDRVTWRMEVADKDELGLLPGMTFRIVAYTGGYTRDVRSFRLLATAIGLNLSAYAVPGAIQFAYGAHPFGANVFIRLRLGPQE